MPKQETFFRESAAEIVIEVLKTYDRSYAQEVFRGISSETQNAVAATLEIDKNYEAVDIPAPDSSEYEEFLWNELCDAALEDVRQSPSLVSFFVVGETRAGKTEDLFISADWPSAEAFAKARLGNYL
jgi:hypothetical protein